MDAASGAPARILVVDDHATNAELLARRLAKAGYAVDCVPDGPTALARLDAEPYDLVLLDVMMPDMSGFEVLDRIRADRSALDLPVLMVTALSDTEDVVHGLERGANDYVTKPIDFPVLLARVRTQLRLRQAEEVIRQMAYVDALTGLPNRRLFHDRLERAVTLARRKRSNLAVFYMDLDRFKAINDTHGHDVGDAVIHAFARRIEAAVRQSDTVARLGGDEFVVLLQELTAPDDAAIVAEKIRRAMDAPIVIGDLALRHTTSIGVARYPADAAEAQALLKAADVAMYHAKRDRNAVRFFHEATETKAPGT